jgi:hypothetical protein
MIGDISPVRGAKHDLEQIAVLDQQHGLYPDVLAGA